jgi:ribonuclease P protein component
MALPKSHRLSLRFERDRLNKLGKSFFGKFFTLVVADSPEDKQINTSRFAILLSKKTAARAVDRNKIKRTTSEIIESALSSIPNKDYLIIPKKQALTEDYKNLSADLKSLFEK